MVLLSKVQVVALHGSDDRQSVSEVLRRIENVVTWMAKEYIEKDEFFDAIRAEFYDIMPTGSEVLSRMLKFPAADVREVCLCQWCYLHTHCRTEDVFDFAGLREENRFCSVGKRKNECREDGGAEDG